MNMGVNSQNMNLNCSRRHAAPVNFGMSAVLHKSAHAVIKKQAISLSEGKKNAFIESIRNFVTGQEKNPVRTVIRKAKHRMALVVEIFDSVDGRDLGIVKSRVVSQSLLSKNGSTKFLNKAAKKADNLNNTNNQVQKLINDIPTPEMKFSKSDSKMALKEQLGE